MILYHLYTKLLCLNTENIAKARILLQYKETRKDEKYYITEEILLKEGKCYKDENLPNRQKMLERRKSSEREKNLSFSKISVFPTYSVF